MTEPDGAKRRKAERRGHAGETRAAWLMRLKGFRIVARRYKCRAGEIDLIARRGDLVAIVEVKARPSLGEAMDAVTAHTARRIIGATDHWLAGQPDHGRLSVRFDLVAILPGRWPIHVPAAFSA
ncbi:MAG: YraN family protein [Roseitalea sp.]|nr:YraN family protein [Roseitalea sp.]MBO6953005.1 YraN family protein [Rhizobiaceae bacterium]MBO6593352.1 YraN family protein [Roseitalea sp.]MBO6600658.1 YraN family protein [Roseitalea sp.]MBO6612339.1 YraN family protein [Roseitalea sp.]